MENPNQPMSRKKSNPSPPSIDDLPDEVLIHILSFLPTKISVSTSILAGRWRFLWAHVPNLHFVHNSTELSIDSIYSKVLLHYQVKDMNAFRLHSDDATCSRPHLKACIEYAIDRKVKQIDLRLHFPNCFPSSIFACKTLVDIKLSGHGNIPTPDLDICLPALKKLYLSRARFDSPESLSHLLSGCPVLEELTVHGLNGCVECLVVSSATINRLDMNTCYVRKIGGNRFTVEIDAPAVTYLKVRDVVSDAVSAGQLDNLIEADVCLDNNWLSNRGEDSDDGGSVDWGIHVYFKEYRWVELGGVDQPDNNAQMEAVADYVSDGDNSDSDDDSDEDSDDSDEEAYKEEEARYARSVLEFVSRLSNVRRLKFTTRWMEVSDSEFSTWFVRFYNLTKLDLRGDWRFIPNFLENADNLETLIIRGDGERFRQWIDPKEVPPCLVSHLGIVRIFSFGCADQGFLMIKYILRNAKVLKKIEIHFEGDGDGLEKKYEALKKISSFPRGSVECELDFF